MNRKAELFRELGEPLAAGMFEEENAPLIERYGRGLRRALESFLPAAYSGRLYPTGAGSLWAQSGDAVRFHASNSLQLDSSRLRSKFSRINTDFDRALLEQGVRELEYLTSGLIPGRFAIGGGSWTHSILNYRRILAEGLDGHRRRVEEMADSPLRHALLDTLAGIDAALEQTPREVAEAFRHPATDFYSAMRSFNFAAALDSYDSFGRFDACLGRFYRGESDAEAWIAEFYETIDRQDGWHMLHSGKYPDFTRLCIRTQRLRRPNSGMLITPETDDRIWEALFDKWAEGIPSPSVYNAQAYRKHLPELSGLRPEDRESFAFGGCTELMFEGRSDIGSIEAGINLLDILNHSTPERFKADILEKIRECACCVRHSTAFLADFRPQLIRTLFTDDCIERGREFHAGGARYAGSVINVAGLTDAANSLAAMRGIRAKFGNDDPEVDAIAADLAEFTFDAIRREPLRGGGFALPGIIMFVTYGYHGSYVGASADGRPAGAPLADSAGAATGTDLAGPTALLNSVAKLPCGLATMVLNLRISRRLAADPEYRPRLKALIQGFFARGGMQIQPTLLDRETLEKAYRSPADYPNLVVRIGGYSEYYQRLDRQLQWEVLKRTEHLAL